MALAMRRAQHEKDLHPISGLKKKKKGAVSQKGARKLGFAAMAAASAAAAV